jgi:hypothetical protein
MSFRRYDRSKCENFPFFEPFLSLSSFSAIFSTVFSSARMGVFCFVTVRDLLIYPAQPSSHADRSGSRGSSVIDCSWPSSPGVLRARPALHRSGLGHRAARAKRGGTRQRLLQPGQGCVIEQRKPRQDRLWRSDR